MGSTGGSNERVQRGLTSTTRHTRHKLGNHARQARKKKGVAKTRLPPSRHKGNVLCRRRISAGKSKQDRRKAPYTFSAQHICSAVRWDTCPRCSGQLFFMLNKAYSALQTLVLLRSSRCYEKLRTHSLVHTDSSRALILYY